MNKELLDSLYSLEEKESNTSKDKLCRDGLISFLKNLRLALFTKYFCDEFNKENVNKYLNASYEDIKAALGNLFPEYEDKVNEFYNSLISIREALMLDVKAIYEGDPASNSYEEIISTYPGFTAIFCYRVAHKFYLMGMKSLARILSEYAHSRTGIDINPGATIGKSFFIDHGTGIVIGETTIIGDNCKLYQGVTLGAMSLKDGRKLVDKKRHPTLLNNVVIYSGASIFGGDTVIGNNVIIGSNVEIKESVPDNTVVRGNFGK